MKTCSHCGHRFHDDDLTDPSPFERLAELFQRSTVAEPEPDLCPRCREEMGMLNLMGFEK
jgi:transposase